MTTIHVHDPKDDGSASAKLTPLPMGGLVIAAWNVLDQAADLPHPHMITVYDTQHISLQFPGEQASYRAITKWAQRFGGALTSGPRDTERGPQTWCRLTFDYHGVTVDAYAHIPAEPAAT